MKRSFLTEQHENSSEAPNQPGSTVWQNLTDIFEPMGIVAILEQPQI